MRKKKWDKISSGLILLVSLIWFVIQQLTGFFTKIGLDQINEIIPFIAVFSAFCMVWSFVWDQKLDYVYGKIQTYENEFMEKFF